MKYVLFVLCALIVIVGVYKVLDMVFPIKPKPAPIPYTEPIVNADKLFQIVNEWRSQNGYQPYKKSDFAKSVATSRLPEVKIVWSHDKFLSDMHSGKLCDGCTLGENLAKGYSTENQALQSWLNSPSHRENLERPYTHSAIVCSNTAENYCVHIFSYF